METDPAVRHFAYLKQSLSSKHSIYKKLHHSKKRVWHFYLSEALMKSSHSCGIWQNALWETQTHKILSVMWLTWILRILREYFNTYSLSRTLTNPEFRIIALSLCLSPWLALFPSLLTHRELLWWNQMYSGAWSSVGAECAIWLVRADVWQKAQNTNITLLHRWIADNTPSPAPVLKLWRTESYRNTNLAQEKVKKKHTSGKCHFTSAELSFVPCNCT